ncbi:MAG: DNA alkylation repair protein [Ignavibacteria bacterium]|nr:DNA alkylation repair protein [Ignavibacteria bacterium]
MNKIIQSIREELKNNSNVQTQKSFQRFFKEEVLCYGLKSNLVHNIAKQYWKEIKHLDKKKIYKMCEELFRSDHCEEAFISAAWLPKLADKYEAEDLQLFKKWIEKYINNWAKCDSFCNHTVGSLIEKFPESISELKNWARSENRWMRRASAVSLIIPARRGKFLKEIFEIADELLLDEDDMVQKGYGWMLKEASRKNHKEVFNYVIKNKRKMPRTALRYAIELMPKGLKTKAMRKD